MRYRFAKMTKPNLWRRLLSQETEANRKVNWKYPSVTFSSFLFTTLFVSITERTSSLFPLVTGETSIIVPSKSRLCISLSTTAATYIYLHSRVIHEKALIKKLFFIPFLQFENVSYDKWESGCSWRNIWRILVERNSKLIPDINKMI